MAVVATIRPACDGIFGPCVAVEEATTNLLQSPLDLTNTAVWQVNSGLYPVSEVPNAGPDGRSAFDLVCNGTLADPFFYQIYNTGTALANRTFTFSVYMRSDTPDDVNPVALYLYDSTAATDVHYLNFTVTQEWQRYILTCTFASTVTDTTIRARIDPSNPTSITPPDGAMVRVALPQLEEKSFATSFVDGTRGAGSLDYPNTVLDYQQGTVALWWQYNSAAIAANIWSMLFTAQDHTPTNEYNKIHIGLTPGIIHFRTADNGAPTTDSRTASISGFQDMSWHFAAMSWDVTANRKTCVLDDQVVFDGTPTALPGKQPDYCHVGSWVGNTFFANTPISNLIILRHAVSAETMLEWYDLRKPFYDPSLQIIVPRPTNVGLTVA